MDIIFPSPETGKRYRTTDSFLKEKFGRKAVKIPLNAGVTCPNKDGTKGTGGCAYCSPSGSGDFGGDPSKPLREQFDDMRRAAEKKWGDTLYIPYFQANTNTYAPLARLRELFEEALSFENTAGLAVSTRPDCISEETADYLAELAERTYLTVELGLQTVHDETAARINRCHTYADFLAGYELLRSRGINICVHIINGLPYETAEMMLETARAAAGLDIHAVKIHLLHIIEGTKLAERYRAGEFAAMDYDSYINIVCSQIEILPPKVIIERLTGDGDQRTLIAPLWSKNKKAVLAGIDKELKRRNTWQGRLYTAP